MCIAYLSLGIHPQWPVFIAANRDEFHARPALAVAPWKQTPAVFAGIDLKAGGTWLGVTRQGRFGLLTNYREPGLRPRQAPSRGALVSDYLCADQAAAAYADAIGTHARRYEGFNLIVGDRHGAWYVGNRTPADGPQALPSGTYVLSNHLLDTPWPKAERLRQALDTFDLDVLPQNLGAVFGILKDTTPADDDTLPRTGLDLARERLLSSPFIIGSEYGTRCSTVIAIRADGRAWISETSYDAAGEITQRHDWPFNLV